MRLLALALITLSSISAHAINIQPSDGHPVCLKREYTRAELGRSPSQKLSSLYVLLSTKMVRNPDGTRQRENTVKVVGTKPDDSNTLYANTAYCDMKSGGQVYCFVECDGGSFTLYPHSSSANFRVTPNYYFPLIKDGKDPDNVTRDEVISLDGSDSANRTYRTYPADVRECERLIRRLPKIKSYSC